MFGQMSVPRKDGGLLAGALLLLPGKSQKIELVAECLLASWLRLVCCRHEVPVTSEPITVIHMDEDVVVVNKPASIPVHPCGRYRHNTVVFILAKEYNLKNLRTIHRLDRLTSGILLFGRTPKKARQMEHQIRNRQVHKQYVCRVEGEFPEEEVVCSEPIEVVSYKIGVCKVSEKGKDCVTRFKRLSYNGKSSVVLCKPQTGRMHQIRVHLQYLGYPVVNDPLYNHVVFGPHKGKGGNIGKTDEELVRDLISIHNAENWLGMDGDSEMSLFKSKLDMEERDLAGNDKNVNSSPEEASSTATLSEEERPQQELKSLKVTVGTQTGSEPPDQSFANDKVIVDPHCYECKVKYRDPKPSDLVMYLHAWRYCGPGWEYETPLPAWAASDWTADDR
ncbi:RNA pseudouridylate synthase domain-containing protein 2-like isoform X2 [Vespula maculifrons]|uniref:Pseudouridine synthase n=1 Tax=Vespula maculifrons TaxID=7453 RepID=A0ABD2BX10_VESMC